MTSFPLLSEGMQIKQMYAQNPGGIESAAAAAIASSGTITTAGPPQVGVARLAPTGAVTGIVMQAGTTPGQTCWVVNEAVAANTITMAASGTSNVAGGVNEVIPGLQGRIYVWDDQTNLWYGTPQLATTPSLTQSGSAAATGAAGTITTASVGVARISPVAARTGVIMQAGTIAGQLCLVANEAAVANSVQMDVSGTSNVADGTNCIIPGLSSRLFVWDSGTSLWYDYAALVGGALYSIPAASAAVTAGSGTIATAGVGIARSNPGGNITGVVLQAGVFQGQEIWVSNESASTITFAASGTSNVADGTTAAIAANTARKFVWIGSLWYRAA